MNDIRLVMWGSFYGSLRQQRDTGSESRYYAMRWMIEADDVVRSTALFNRHRFGVFAITESRLNCQYNGGVDFVHRPVECHIAEKLYLALLRSWVTS